MGNTSRSRAIGIALAFLFAAFVCWNLIPGTSAQKKGPFQRSAAPSGQPAVPSEDDGMLLLNARQIAVASSEAQSERKSIEGFAGKRLHLVRFSGPIQSKWVGMLTDAGVEIVDYIPHYTYMVYGDSVSLQRIQSKAAEAASPVQWDGPFKDEYKIQPSVHFDPKRDHGREGLRSAEFEIQLYKDDAANRETLELINKIGTQELKGLQTVRHFVNFVVGLDAEGLERIAKQPDVVSIYPYLEPRLMDERLNMILRGNLTGTQPTPGDYLAYLASRGFTQAQFDASNFVVDVSDSGVDTATPASPNQFALRRLGDPAGASRFAYSRIVGTQTGTAQGCDGHGNLNSTIVAGYVPTGGIFAAFPHADALGYRYGLGVAPFVKVGSSTIFTPSFSSPNLPNLQSMAYNDGARISTNSWGSTLPNGAYNANAQTFDGLVRDAQPTGSTNATAGNQEMVIVFSAGNDGPTATTVAPPGSGKNIISVGASENVHPFGGSDFCGTGDIDANSALDVVDFSSRGPAADGRIKPDIMLPGTHVTGGVAQASNVTPVSGNGAQLACFNANGVCGGVDIDFFPAGQTWYTASTGTSHSTPAIAGFAALIRQHFINQTLAPPSPAMTKALIMNSAEYMTGNFANDSLPSNSQGMGLADMDRYFDIFAQTMIYRDQAAADLFTNSGQQRVFTGTVVDNTKPFRVTLAWTDPPGPTSGNAYVNNLDLEVIVAGTTYKGNVFTGANSSTGGNADVRNNVESVFLPAGVSGPFAVKVKATNIAGDGLPGDADTTDQDFVLLVSNANEAPLAVVERSGLSIISENGTPANNTPDPGESLTVRLALQNIGTGPTGSTTVTLQNSGGITNPSGQQTYGILTSGGGAVERDFSFKVPAGAACGSQITLTFQINDGTNIFNNTQTYTLGMEAVSLTQNFDGVTAPALPAGWTTTQTVNGVLWVTSTTSAISAPNSAFAPDPSTNGDTKLESPLFMPSSPATKVNFNLTHVTENTWDGMVLEVKIGAGDWQDILAAGGSFTQNAYNGTLGNFSTCVTNGTQNPIASRSAWTGNSNGTKAVKAVLPASAQGQNVQIRFRMGHDCSVSSTGVRVDDIQIIGGFECAIAAAPNAVRGDFDGDLKTDLAVFRPSEGNWYLNQSTDGWRTVGWGLNGDKIQPGDFDADGKTDFGVFRPSNNTWYGIFSDSNTLVQAEWGLSGDIPVAGHYRPGDLEDEPAVWRPSSGRWYVYGDAFGGVAWGLPGDLPVPADYNGDGTTDYGVYRPSEGKWYILFANGAIVTANWGLSGDRPVPADYDGDGNDDFAVWRPSNGRWYVIKSASGHIEETGWGLPGDIPVPGDYDGNGSFDRAVYRPSEGRWYQLRTNAGIFVFDWGLNNDIPAPEGYIPKLVP